MNFNICGKRITIVIDTASDAFVESDVREVGRILRTMAERIEEVGLLPVPRDLNGNVAGSVTIGDLPV